MFFDVNNSVLKVYNDRIRELLDMGVRTTETSFLRDPLVMDWEDDCWKVPVAWADHIDGLKDTVFQPIKGFATRVYEHAIRIAAARAIFKGQTRITPEIAQAATILMHWFVMQRMRVENAVPTRSSRDTKVHDLAVQVRDRLANRHAVKNEIEWSKRDMARLAVQGVFKPLATKRQRNSCRHREEVSCSIGVFRSWSASP
jgi:hypothetical protein